MAEESKLFIKKVKRGDCDIMRVICLQAVVNYREFNKTEINVFAAVEINNTPHEYVGIS
jgi:hypothetical protein